MKYFIQKLENKKLSSQFIEPASELCSDYNNR